MKIIPNNQPQQDDVMFPQTAEYLPFIRYECAPVFWTSSVSCQAVSSLHYTSCTCCRYQLADPKEKDQRAQRENCFMIISSARQSQQRKSNKNELM